MIDGYLEEGDKCPECGGVMEYPHMVENCSCHISPPCSACLSVVITCSSCGYEQEEPVYLLKPKEYKMKAHDVVTNVVKAFNKTAEFHAEGLICPMEALQEMLYAVTVGINKLDDECPDCAVKETKSCRECAEYVRTTPVEELLK